MKIIISTFFVLSALCLNAQEKPKKATTEKTETVKKEGDSCCSGKSENKSAHKADASSVAMTSTCHEGSAKKGSSCCADKTAKK